MTADDSLLLKQTQAAKENACKAAEISKQLQNGDNSVYSKITSYLSSAVESLEITEQTLQSLTDNFETSSLLRGGEPKTGVGGDASSRGVGADELDVADHDINSDADEGERLVKTEYSEDQYQFVSYGRDSSQNEEEKKEEIDLPEKSLSVKSEIFEGKLDEVGANKITIRRLVENVDALSEDGPFQQEKELQCRIKCGWNEIFGEEYLGLYVEVKPTSSPGDAWCYPAQIETRLYNHAEDTYATRNFDQTFCSGREIVGAHDFIKRREVLDESKGFLKNGRLVLEANIVINEDNLAPPSEVDVKEEIVELYGDTHPLIESEKYESLDYDEDYPSDNSLEEEKRCTNKKKEKRSLKEDAALHCQICGKQFSDKRRLRDHMYLHEGKKPFSCDLCGMEFTRKDNLKMHLARHKRIKTFPCKICGEEFSEGSALKEHILVHQGEKPFSCDKCGESFKDMKYLRYHMKIHDKKVPCEICGKPFIDRALKVHMLIHADDHFFSCEKCGKAIKGKRYFKEHMKNHDEKKVPCKTCGKLFFEKTLRKHEKIHVEEKRFSCDTCGKLFRRKDFLTLHMKRKHEGNEAFTCDICGKSFISKHSLSLHLPMHDDHKDLHTNFTDPSTGNNGYNDQINSNDKAIVCKICQKVFSTPLGLKRHMMMHEDIRPFACEICEKSFTQSQVLQSHMRIHKGIKPYSCDICGKSFTQKGTLNRHRSSHTALKKEEPFPT